MKDCGDGAWAALNTDRHNRNLSRFSTCLRLDAADNALECAPHLKFRIKAIVLLLVALVSRILHQDKMRVVAIELRFRWISASLVSYFLILAFDGVISCLCFVATFLEVFTSGQWAQRCESYQARCSDT